MSASLSSSKSLFKNKQPKIEATVHIRYCRPEEAGPFFKQKAADAENLLKLWYPKNVRVIRDWYPRNTKTSEIIPGDDVPGPFDIFVSDKIVHCKTTLKHGFLNRNTPSERQEFVKKAIGAALQGETPEGLEIQIREAMAKADGEREAKELEAERSMNSTNSERYAAKKEEADGTKEQKAAQSEEAREKEADPLQEKGAAEAADREAEEADITDEAKRKAEAEAKSKAEAEAGDKAKVDAEREAEAKVDAEAKDTADAEAKSETKAEAKVAAEAKAEEDAQANAEVEASSKAADVVEPAKPTKTAGGFFSCCSSSPDTGADEEGAVQPTIQVTDAATS